MSIFAWIIFGLIAGLFATALDAEPTAENIIGSIILSILGSVLGGLLASTVFNMDITTFSLQTLLMAALGSAFLLFISRAFRNT